MGKGYLQMMIRTPLFSLVPCEVCVLFLVFLSGVVPKRGETVGYSGGYSLFRAFSERPSVKFEESGAEENPYPPRRKHHQTP